MPCSWDEVEKQHITYMEELLWKKVWTCNASEVDWVELEHYPKSREITALEENIQALEQKLTTPLLSLSEKQQYQKNLKDFVDQLRCENLKHRFKLEPQKFSTTVNVKIHPMAPQTELKCNMYQLRINLNDATTGHKLQGMSKDVVIISSWPKGGLFKNWEYVVLSRVRTVTGLYLFEPIVRRFQASNISKFLFLNETLLKENFWSVEKAI